MSSIKRPALLAGLCALAVLAGCASTHQPVQGERADAPTPLDKFQIKTHEAPDQMGMSIHAEGLSAAQRDALAGFVARWRTAGGGTITLQAPSDAPDVGAARTFVMATESTLAVLGVPYERIRTAAYVQGPAPKALLLASFDTTVADAPDCKAIPWENLTANKSNAAYNRFGCVLTANLAAEIADPRDLRGDTPMAPADGTRRMVTLDNYRKGKQTASEKDPQASGAVSSSVSQ
jgi:pilus assembly protein CpaD